MRFPFFKFVLFDGKKFKKRTGSSLIQICKINCRSPLDSRWWWFTRLQCKMHTRVDWAKDYFPFWQIKSDGTCTAEFIWGSIECCYQSTEENSRKWSTCLSYDIQFNFVEHHRSIGWCFACHTACQPDDPLDNWDCWNVIPYIRAHNTTYIQHVWIFKLCFFSPPKIKKHTH